MQVDAPNPNVALHPRAPLIVLPNPRERQRADALTGVDIQDGQGQTWRFRQLPLARDFDPIRDRMYDQSVLKGTVDLIDIYVCGLAMLTDNYDLTPDEGRMILFSMERDALVRGVAGGVFRPDAFRRTYSAWARASCWLNGVNPDTVPGEDLPHVLYLLQRTGRTIPLDEYTEASEANNAWNALAALAKPKAKPADAE